MKKLALTLALTIFPVTVNSTPGMDMWGIVTVDYKNTTCYILNKGKENESISCVSKCGY